MISLLIFLLLLCGSFVLTALLLTWSARRAGSSRAKFRFGVLATGIIVLMNGALVIAEGFLLQTTALPKSFALFLLLGTQTVGTLIILSQVFGIRLLSTLLPFCLVTGVGVVELVLVLAVLRPFVLEAFVIPTQSMTPTLSPSDRFVVSKLIAPRRLDLIAYRTSSPRPAIYCKRVIGLPGERVRFEQGGVFINDQPIALPLTLAGHCKAAPASTPPGSERYHERETIQLAADEYFVIGDNVDVSIDSRLEGPTRRSALVGVVDLIYWPINKFRVVR